IFQKNRSLAYSTVPKSCSPYGSLSGVKSEKRRTSSMISATSARGRAVTPVVKTSSPPWRAERKPSLSSRMRELLHIFFPSEDCSERISSSWSAKIRPLLLGLGRLGVCRRFVWLKRQQRWVGFGVSVEHDVVAPERPRMIHDLGQDWWQWVGVDPRCP